MASSRTHPSRRVPTRARASSGPDAIAQPIRSDQRRWSRWAGVRNILFGGIILGVLPCGRPQQPHSVDSGEGEAHEWDHHVRTSHPAPRGSSERSNGRPHGSGSCGPERGTAPSIGSLAIGSVGPRLAPRRPSAEQPPAPASCASPLTSSRLPARWMRVSPVLPRRRCSRTQGVPTDSVDSATASVRGSRPLNPPQLNRTRTSRKADLVATLSPDAPRSGQGRRHLEDGSARTLTGPGTQIVGSGQLSSTPAQPPITVDHI